MNQTTINGRVAELSWGYHQAAVLGSWTITVNPSGCALTATVVSHDAYRTSQPSVRFRVTRQHAAPWVWPVTALHIADGTLTASLGPQE